MEKRGVTEGEGEEPRPQDKQAADRDPKAVGDDPLSKLTAKVAERARPRAEPDA